MQVSFADFLRLNWHEEVPVGRMPRRRRARVPRGAPGGHRDNNDELDGHGNVANDNNNNADPIRLHAEVRNIPAPAPAPVVMADNEEHDIDVWEDISDDDLDHEMDADDRAEQIHMFDAEQRQIDAPVRPPHNRGDGADGPRADIFFDDNGVLDDLDAMAAQDPVNAVEIRIALNDVLGFYGSLTILLRSTVFFFFFNLCYIWTFGYVPLRIGNLYYSYFGVAPSSLTVIYGRLPTVITSFLSELFEHSRKINHLIALEDMLVILLGYTSICAFIFSLSAISYFIQEKDFGFPMVTPKLIKLSLSIVSIASSILKVGALLFVRIFWLPVIIGCMALFCCNTLFEFTQMDFITLIVENTIGFISIAWVSGISFMLVVTLSVLQLREVLHPDILARRIRPQEAHMDLLNALVNDGGLAHIRRIITSIIIYSSLLGIFLWLPTCILRIICGKLDIHVYFVSSNLQIPFEMAMIHFFFLGALEKHKDCIGKFQYRWLVYACHKLDLTSYVLPVASQNPQVSRCISKYF